MQKAEDIKIAYPLSVAKLVKTGKSAVVDTADTHATMLVIPRGSGTSSCKYYFYHASASTTLSGSATAFTAGASVTTTGASAVHGVLITNQPSMKRYLIIKQSTLAASLAIGVVSLSFYNRAVPPSSTLGAFTSLTRPTV